MKHLLLVAALTLPLLHGVAIAAKDSPSNEAAANNPFTAERNKAIGNLSTSIVILQKMGSECKNQAKLSEEKIKSSQNKWIERNKNYLQMHADYMNGYFATIRQFEGEEQAKKVVNDMGKVFNEQANTVVQLTLEKNGKSEACLKYFQLLGEGKMDIKKGYPDYKILTEMVEYSKRNTPQAGNK
jgi:hypothetical protein